MLSTMFIPFTVTMIPNYLMISKIGLRDCIWGVALPQFADVLGIFLLRQSMRGIPKALIEASRMEGIGNLKIMKDIVIPLVRPSILTTGIIFFINSWNEYVWPVLILKTKENYTLSLALQMYISAEGGTDIIYHFPTLYYQHLCRFRYQRMIRRKDRIFYESQYCI